MTSKWKPFKIDDLKKDKPGSIAIGPFGSRMKSDCYVEKGVPVIRGTNIGDGKDFKGEFVYITKEKAKELGSANVYKRDLVFPHRGAIGEVGIVHKDKHYVLSSSLMKLTCNEDIVNPEFLYYFFKTREGRNELLKNASQVGTPGIGQPLTSLKGIYVKLPEKNIQDNIVDVINSIDDKIANNHLLNNTLDEIALTLFKSWFVEFEPVKAKMQARTKGIDSKLAAMMVISGKTEEEIQRLPEENQKELEKIADLFPDDFEESQLGLIPKGWDISSINRVAKVIKGMSYKSIELKESNTALVTLKSFKRGGGYRLDGLKEYTGKYKPEQEVKIGDLIVSYTDVTQNADIIGKPALITNDNKYNKLIISLDVAAIKPQNKKLKHFLYGLMSMDRFQNHTKSYTSGTTVLHLSKNAVPEYRFCLPTIDLVIKFHDIINPLFNIIVGNTGKNYCLVNLRDSMLPNLMNGKIKFV